MGLKLSQLAGLAPTNSGDRLYVVRDGIGYFTYINSLSGLDADKNNVFNNIYVLQTGFIARIIGGDYNNNVGSGEYSAVLAGTFNLNSGKQTIIGGGGSNIIQNGFRSLINGGGGNTISGNWNTIGGGRDNQAISTNYSTVGGGINNLANASSSVVAGGRNNEATANDGSIVGGNDNSVMGIGATVVGGTLNIASGLYSVVPGGGENYARGDYAFAAGYQSYAMQPGSFTLSDSTAGPKYDGGPDSISFHFSGGAYFTGQKSIVQKTFGSVVVGSGLTQHSTEGFLYVPATTGHMNSTPRNQGDFVPIVFDTGNNAIRAYNRVSSTWVGITGNSAGGGGAINNTSSYASGLGTNYILTNNFTRIDFGTQDAEVSIPDAATYLVIAIVSVVPSGGEESLVTIQFYDTIAADGVIGSQKACATDGTRQTQIVLQNIVTVTADANRKLQLYGKSDYVTSAPTVLATHTSISAIKLA